jgi:hypothetical protein
MVSRVERSVDLRGDGEPRRRESGDDDGTAWDSRSAADTWREERPQLSLARKLERSHHPAGRVARWLFIEGGIVIVFLSGLIGLGLAGALLT